MSSEGGGMGSERGQICSGGGGRELVGRALIAVCGGRCWCHLVVVGCPCCLLVPWCRSFIVIRLLSLSFVCIALLASGIAQLERGDVNVLAVDCHWAVNSGLVPLVGWVCYSGQGYLLHLFSIRQQ